MTHSVMIRVQRTVFYFARCYDGNRHDIYHSLWNADNGFSTAPQAILTLLSFIRQRL